MTSTNEDIDSWNDYAFVAKASTCWWCGRRGGYVPGWNAPFMIERAHIVSKPRRKDRRVAALLCSRCHKVQHGERIFIPGDVVLQPTLAELLWLKKVNDPEYYDLGYMQKQSVSVLPKPVMPGQRVWRVPNWSEWFKINGSKLFHHEKEVLLTLHGSLIDDIS